MNKIQEKDLVKATAPMEGQARNSFTGVQLDAFKSGYIDSYEEALDLLDQYDITERKGKYKWKDR